MNTHVRGFRGANGGEGGSRAREGATEKPKRFETVLPESSVTVEYRWGAPGWRAVAGVGSRGVACRRPRNRGLANT